MAVAEGAVILLAVAVIAVAVLLRPAYLRAFRRELSRSDELARTAASLGLAFSADDPTFPSNLATRYPFELFTRGIEQRCENVLSGSHRGADVVAFDLWWVEQLRAADPDTRGPRSEWSRTCALATFPGDTPYLRLTPETPLDRLVFRAGVPEIDLEWGDFDRAFRVFASDRRFATEFLDPPMMAWLHDEGRAWCWEVQRGFVLCHAPRLVPADLPRMLDVLAGVRARIPRVVLA